MGKRIEPGTIDVSTFGERSAVRSVNRQGYRAHRRRIGSAQLQ